MKKRTISISILKKKKIRNDVIKSIKKSISLLVMQAVKQLREREHDDELCNAGDV
jgi:hypothetical protein